MRIGDITYGFVVANSLLFCACILLQSADMINIFSPLFDKDGFCVSFKDTLFQSHALCFYVDTFATLILYGLMLAYGKDKPGMDIFGKNIGSIFGHGCGHLFLYMYPPDHSLMLQWNGTFDLTHVGSRFLMFFAFWYLFLMALDKVSTFFLVLQSTVHTVMLLYVVPQSFGFTYVQTVLLTTFGVYEMYKENKDKYYDLYALCVAFPIGLVGWLESLTCDTFLVNWGGHIWYDSTIPLSMLVYLAAVVYVGEKKKENTKKLA